VTDRAKSSAQRPIRLIRTAKLVSAGKSDKQIRHLVARGGAVRIGRGIYVLSTEARRLAELPGGEHIMRVTAALAVSGPAAVASHQSAARLHGLDLIGEAAADVVLTWTPGRGWRPRAGVRYHAASLPATHVTTKYGMPVTSAARTVIDMARTEDFKAGVVIADCALRKKLTSKEELRAVIGVCRRWQGARKAAAVVEFADRLSESALESIGRVAFRGCGLPSPELQAWVGDDEIVGRADFFWRDYGTIAEADGALKYTDPRRARAQLQRDAKLREAGFEVVHFTWQQINWEPALVAARIRAAFKRASLLSEVEAKGA
jgi:predicted transcriptional regulator of viral defense system